MSIQATQLQLTIEHLAAACEEHGHPVKEVRAANIDRMVAPTQAEPIELIGVDGRTLVRLYVDDLGDGAILRADMAEWVYPTELVKFDLSFQLPEDA